MGGKCDLYGKITRDIKEGPECTDNFQVCGFEYNGYFWQSVEQCYQAHKFEVGSKEFDAIHDLFPRENESDWDYGIRSWELGQVGEIRNEWDDIKLKTMLLINLTKFAQNEDLCWDLMETEGYDLRARPSTWEWQKWNTLIMEYIRRNLIWGNDLNSVSHITSANNREIEIILEEVE